MFAIQISRVTNQFLPHEQIINMGLVNKQAGCSEKRSVKPPAAGSIFRVYIVNSWESVLSPSAVYDPAVQSVQLQQTALGSVSLHRSESTFNSNYESTSFSNSLSTM
jgi:hypothetical protein